MRMQYLCISTVDIVESDQKCCEYSRNHAEFWRFRMKWFKRLRAEITTGKRLIPLQHKNGFINVIHLAAGRCLPVLAGRPRRCPWTLAVSPARPDHGKAHRRCARRVRLLRGSQGTGFGLSPFALRIRFVV